MVISHRHRYLFVELPHAGSTAVAEELCAHYDGQQILTKHAPYHQFLRLAGPAERRYFVFSAIRNPLDEAVSLYFKYKTNHKSNYTDPARLAVNGGWVAPGHLRRYRFVQRGAGFPAYLRRFYRLPYENWSSLAHRRFDYVLRFERLAEDFAAVLARLGLPAQRPLPVCNPTAAKERDFPAYYPPEVRRHAVRVFGPFMSRWGYEFPAEWNAAPCPWTWQAAYETVRFAKNLARRVRRPRRGMDGRKISLGEQTA